MQREEILKELLAQIRVNGHIIGTVAGSGMTAKYTAMGGADLILALSAGKSRLMGRSSYASYLCYANSNQIVMDLGTRELLPIISGKPILFGLNACDPFISLYDYIMTIKNNGFSGIVNFPTVCLFDGQFREALEEEGNSYEKEIEAIHIANFLDLFTIAFVNNEEQARKMTEAGADIICVHFGLTKGGYMGAKKYLTLEKASLLADKIFQTCEEIRPDVIKMVYGGPVTTPIDMHFIYQNTACMGYIGGSTFDRIPTEEAIFNTTKAFKSNDGIDDHFMTKIVKGNWNRYDYVQFVKKYISENYMNRKLYLSDLALVAHISVSYLSTKFKQEVGCSFTKYLVRFRIEKAKDILSQEPIPLKKVADMVGYNDYAQFSKMFKKYVGVPPSVFAESNINTRNNNLPLG
ncbi:MAG: phosphoenolpyruvate hydrolase family protein [Flexilinea sp.]